LNHRYGVRHKGGKATAKQSILVAIQRQGPVFPVPVDTVKTDTISPIIYAVADTSADLMTDKSYVFQQTGKQFASHQSVYHMAKEYARGNVHINTAESFNAMLERVKTGVFHYMSPKHLGRYLTELSFRWSNRDPKEVVTKMGKKKTIWIAFCLWHTASLAKNGSSETNYVKLFLTELAFFCGIGPFNSN
jgi:hypothetical protein